MYEFVHGTVYSVIPGLAVIEAGGVGYRIQVPFSTSEALGGGGEVRLLLHHTINAEQGEERLYGFLSDRERELFRALLLVQGVGPSTALQMMCAASPDQLIAAITSGDLVTLKRLKGIGPKRAERLVIELKERLQPLAVAPRIAARQTLGTGTRHDAMLALVALGYPSAKSKQAVESAAEKLGGTAATEALVKAALQLM